MSDKKTRMLILDGGFGGLYVALEFEKRCNPRFEVTVVNRENSFLFTPMLREIAASDLDLTNIVNPIRKMIRHINLFCGDAHELEYDHLVLALWNCARLSRQEEHDHKIVNPDTIRGSQRRSEARCRVRNRPLGSTNQHGNFIDR
jgi:hypothetical protein